MDQLILKYAIIFGLTVFGFANFIACGARMYQVSLVDDHDSRSVPRHAADQASPYFGIHAVDGWQKLPIHFKVSHDLNEQQQNGLRRAMATWEIAVGKKLFEFEGTHDATGDSFKDLYSSLQDNINGHYLDHDWKKTKKPEIVLATTIWSNDQQNIDAITSADIHFNSEHYVIGNSFQVEQAPGDGREIVDMESLALHELGHLLGLAHVEPKVDKHSIMNPSLYIGEGLVDRSLSEGDIKRIQQIYGCDGSACDLEEVIKKLADHEAASTDEKTTEDKESDSSAEKPSP